ncbi:hypothetical protein HPB47_016851 [Ixodes persulcatus]|uniref:Uncharacterized protein n=1 Tax=Ixodes persulcatus TaxID=34615 RepID=A0AC60QTF3_IXOPE|nr:hypothetical protein HPB47_016851 [Ixodes persulcatus]
MSLLPDTSNIANEAFYQAAAQENEPLSDPGPANGFLPITTTDTSSDSTSSSDIPDSRSYLSSRSPYNVANASISGMLEERARNGSYAHVVGAPTVEKSAMQTIHNV